METQISLESAHKSKSSLRLKYEAETQVIRRKIGELESIREQLGLSQRKICQLLMVDPSAWTRWTKSGEDAPPHIYRMLQWYLAIEEKYPALDVNFWLNSVARIDDKNRVSEAANQAQLAQQTAQQAIQASQELNARLSKQVQDLSTQLQKQKRMTIAAAFLAVFLPVLFLIGWLFRSGTGSFG